jgi:NhaP-type Na+/H+ or K+/H+ antiporter
MEHQLEAVVAVIAGCLVIWGLVSARLERWDLTGPIAFLLVGLVFTNGPLAVVHLHLTSSAIRSVAEFTLALVLFADASRVNVRALRANAAIPIRLLCIGLPLTIGAGAVAAAGLFGGSGWWLAAAIGAIVAPTDAALGASVIQDERVPAGVRRALNVESGLNDGIATPFVNLFLAGAVATEAIHGPGVAHAALELLGGAGLGIVIGAAGAALMTIAQRAGWSAKALRPLAAFALALVAYSTALLAGTNGFVAAFVAGLAFGAGVPGEELLYFAEEAGLLLSAVVWFIFGSVMVVEGFKVARWQDFVFAILALTVIRMVPVALSLVGAKCDRATIAFIGWFGPRGLASVVFGLIAVDSLAPADAKTIIGAVTVTVTLSVFAHGLSASPLAQRYGMRAHAFGSETPERTTTMATLPARKLTTTRRRGTPDGRGPAAETDNTSERRNATESRTEAQDAQPDRTDG